MNIRRIILSLPLLLAVAAPVAEAGGNRHVEINFGFGHHFPVPHHPHIRVAPVIVYEPPQYEYYQPAYRPRYDRYHVRYCKNRHHHHGRGHYDDDKDEDDDD